MDTLDTLDTLDTITRILQRVCCGPVDNAQLALARQSQLGAVAARQVLGVNLYDKFHLVL